jgi:hypothetical protein
MLDTAAAMETEYRQGQELLENAIGSNPIKIFVAVHHTVKLHKQGTQMSEFQRADWFEKSRAGPRLLTRSVADRGVEEARVEFRGAHAVFSGVPQP